MYIILWWLDNYLTAIHNENGSIRLFKTLRQADDYADAHSQSDNMRVCSVEGVHE